MLVFLVIAGRIHSHIDTHCSSIIRVTEMQSGTKTTYSADETERVGELIGAQLLGGEVIELSSDVGGGKTTLARGIVRGAGSRDMVASPTFTVSNLYSADSFSIVHFDFYRIQHDIAMVAHELAEVTQDESSVVIIEWSESVRAVLPEDTVAITIQTISESDRRISWRSGLEKAYLFEGLAS